jgi:type II secretory pathway component PulJ
MGWGTAKMKRQTGVSIIEMLVASAAGIMAISLVGSLYISVQNHASERSQLLLLNQALSTTARRIQNDMIRAGYNGEESKSWVPSGASSTIYVSQSGAVAQYAYYDRREIGNPKEKKKLENVVWAFDKDTGKLSICRSRTLVESGARSTLFSAETGCTSNFEPNLIKVTNFSVRANTVGSNSAAHQYINLTIDAELRGNPSVFSSLTRQFMVRNGQ